ncbi:MAG: YcaO-like family protein [Mangrovibacterium sp.]
MIFFSNKSSDVRMVPYFNLSSGESVYLPDKLVRKCSGSNGMAAGNTPAEAIVQGISEIIERYVTKKIIFEERLLPEIASSEFESENLIQIIKRIEKSGYYLVKIKDCTLGGKFPALGVLVIDPKRNKSHLRFGASPSKEIALERCLTEFFQGFNDNTWHNRFEKMRWGTRKTTEENKWKEFRQTAKDGKGKLPDSLFLPAKKINWFKRFYS